MMMRDSKGRFSTTREQTKDELKPEPKCIRYYSDKLDKYFENYEDLVNAEKAKEEEQKAIESQRNEKRELGAKVEEAFKNYESAINESNEKIAQVQKEMRDKVTAARKEYVDRKNEFIDKYGYFHMTFRDKEPKVSTENEPTTYSDFMKTYTDFMRNFFDNWKF